MKQKPDALHQEVGTCAHGKALHYRYPCAACVADLLADRVSDEVAAGFTGAVLRERVHRLIESAVTSLLERISQ